MSAHEQWRELGQQLRVDSGGHDRDLPVAAVAEPIPSPVATATGRIDIVAR